MARRRGRRGSNGRRRAEGQPQPSAAAIDRLDGCTLAVVADFCSLRDCCVLRHRISKRTSQQLAPADASEAFARARVLRLVERWWRATLLLNEHCEDTVLSWVTRYGKKNHIAHQLRVLLRARHVRTLRLGGLAAFYEYSLAAAERGVQLRWNGPRMDLVPRPSCLRGLNVLETLRKMGLQKSRNVMDIYHPTTFIGGCAESFYHCFRHQRFSEFLALDKALRRGTQRPRGCLVGPWRFLEQSLCRHHCFRCNRFLDQRRPEFHSRTTRRGVTCGVIRDCVSNNY